MRFKLTRFIVFALAALCVAFPAVAADKGTVAVTLTGQKVVKGPDGKEKFESADKAKPGDIIMYKAVYQNKGKEMAADVKATIPVPPGTEYVAGSAVPPQVMASVDGKDYAPVPLKRKVKLPSGKEELRNVPIEDYRFIRWDLKTLAPGKNATVSMKVKISATPAQTEAPAKK